MCERRKRGKNRGGGSILRGAETGVVRFGVSLKSSCPERWRLPLGLEMVISDRRTVCRSTSIQTIHQDNPCRQGMASEVTCISAGTLPQRLCVTADQVPRRGDPSFYLSAFKYKCWLKLP